MPRMRQLTGAICAALAAAALLPAAGGAHRIDTSRYSVLQSVALEQCVTAPSASARLVSFAAEIHALRRASRMSIQIDLQERLPGERFKTVKGPGIGLWRAAVPGVAAFQSTRTLSNLTAPAKYRALVYFRWSNKAGRTIRHESAYSGVCDEPLPPQTRRSHVVARAVAPLELRR